MDARRPDAEHGHQPTADSGSRCPTRIWELRVGDLRVYYDVSHPRSRLKPDRHAPGGSQRRRSGPDEFTDELAERSIAGLAEFRVLSASVKTRPHRSGCIDMLNSLCVPISRTVPSTRTRDRMVLVAASGPEWRPPVHEIRTPWAVLKTVGGRQMGARQFRHESGELESRMELFWMISSSKPSTRKNRCTSFDPWPCEAVRGSLLRDTFRRLLETYSRRGSSG